MRRKASQQNASSTEARGFFATFDAVRIINLEYRTDRRRQMDRQLARAGLTGDPRVAFFPAVKVAESAPFSSSGARGCFLSHFSLLQAAAKDGHRLLILEDDCDFLVCDIVSYDLPSDWDIFYGGYFARNPDNLADSDIIGSYFMGFSPRAARIAADYLTDYLEPDFPADPRAAAEPGYDHDVRPSIDGAFVWLRRAHPELVTVFKMLGVQRASRTDIGESKIYDRLPVVRHMIERVRRLRAAVRPDSMRKAAFGVVDD